MGGRLAHLFRCLIFLGFLLLASSSVFASGAVGTPPASGLSPDVLKQLDRFESLSQITQPQKFYRETSTTWELIARDLQLVIESPVSEISEALAPGSDRGARDLDQWHLDINNRFVLLKRAGAQRARALRIVQGKGVSLFEVEDHLIERVILEITLIPYKLKAYFYEKSYWVIQNLNTGFWGFYNIGKEGVLLLLALFLPFLFVRSSARLNRIIEQQRRKSFYKSFQSRWHRNLAFTLSILTVYLPWLFAYVALIFVEKTLLASEFQEVAYLVPYVYYYIYYKIFRVTLELGLQELASHSSTTDSEYINGKVKATSKTLGLFLLFLYSLETALHSVVGDSLIYTMIEPFFGYTIFALLLYVSGSWHKEIQQYLCGTNLVYAKKMADQMQGLWIYPLSLIGLVFIVVHFLSSKLIFWSSQFEIVKLLYAKVLRVKFETSRSMSEGMSPVDEAYLTQFQSEVNTNYYDFFSDTSFYGNLQACFAEWQVERDSENTVGLFGGRGSGKTEFLKAYAQTVGAGDCRVHQIDVPPKVFTEKSFDALFANIQQLDDGDECGRYCVLVDNAHNLFLSTIGGFQIYNRFLELIEKNKNVFWVVSFNDQSWQFLNSVLGVNQYFRLELRVPRWTVEQIKEFILQRHKQTDCRLEYDQIFKSNQKLQEGISSAENRYFYLLWERCGGNPGLACAYWFRSLNRLSESRYLVSLPRDNDVTVLSTLQQDMNFVYASLLKHENLNISEATRATNISRVVVRQALIRGIEEGFLESKEGRYRVSLDWIDDVKRYLKGKNLIYESN